MRIGPIIIMPANQEAFYGHFIDFWKRMPLDMKDAARASAIHLKYRPGMKPKAPQPTTVTIDAPGMKPKEEIREGGN